MESDSNMVQLKDNNISAWDVSDPFAPDAFKQTAAEQVVWVIAKWAEDRNITAEGGATSYTQIPKLIEEVYEFRDATTEEEAKLEFGDILVVCIQIARLRGLDMVECLDLAYQKIKDRKGRLENGVFIKDAA